MEIITLIIPNEKKSGFGDLDVSIHELTDFKTTKGNSTEEDVKVPRVGLLSGSKWYSFPKEVTGSKVSANLFGFWGILTDLKLQKRALKKEKKDGEDTNMPQRLQFAEQTL